MVSAHHPLFGTRSSRRRSTSCGGPHRGTPSRYASRGGSASRLASRGGRRRGRGGIGGAGRDGARAREGTALSTVAADSTGARSDQVRQELVLPAERAQPMGPVGGKWVQGVLCRGSRAG